MNNKVLSVLSCSEGLATLGNLFSRKIFELTPAGPRIGRNLVPEKLDLVPEELDLVPGLVPGLIYSSWRKRELKKMWRKTFRKVAQVVKFRAKIFSLVKFGQITVPTSSLEKSKTAVLGTKIFLVPGNFLIYYF